jgi:hypothetical protein
MDARKAVAGSTERDAVVNVVSLRRELGVRPYVMRVHAGFGSMAAALARVVISALHAARPQLNANVIALFCRYAAFPIVMDRASQGRMARERLRQLFAVFCALWFTDLGRRYFRAMVCCEVRSAAVVTAAVAQRLTLVFALRYRRLFGEWRLLSAAARTKSAAFQVGLGDAAIVADSKSRLVVAIPRSLVKWLAASTCAKHGQFYYAGRAYGQAA